MKVSQKWARRGFGPRWLPLAPIGPRWPPLAPIGPHWPPAKGAKNIIKLVVSAMLKQTCEFHWGLRVKTIQNHKKKHWLYSKSDKQVRESRIWLRGMHSLGC